MKEINIVGDRRSGRTTSLISIALGLALETPGSKILFVTHSYSEAMIVISEMANKLNLFSEVTRPNKNLLSLSNGSKIASVNFNGEATKGQVVDYVIIDNADYMSEDAKLSVFVMLPDAKSLITSSDKPFKIQESTNVK